MLNLEDFCLHDKPTNEKGSLYTGWSAVTELVVSLTYSVSSPIADVDGHFANETHTHTSKFDCFKRSYKLKLRCQSAWKESFVLKQLHLYHDRSIARSLFGNNWSNILVQRNVLWR